jgi:hypothetical protein
LPDNRKFLKDHLLANLKSFLCKEQRLDGQGKDLKAIICKDHLSSVLPSFVKMVQILGTVVNKVVFETKPHQVSQGISVYVSTLTMTIIALDRFVVVCYPYRQRMQIKTSLLFVAITDLLAGDNFTRVLQAAFLYQRYMSRFSALTFNVCGGRTLA